MIETIPHYSASMSHASKHAGRPLKNAPFRSGSSRRSRSFVRGEAKILTTGIQGVSRGFKFESDAEIGRKRVFFKGLARCLERNRDEGSFLKGQKNNDDENNTL